MEQYVQVTNRLIDCVERRAGVLGRPAQIEDLVSQLSIRSEALSNATAKVEIAALKKILGSTEEGPAGLLWPTGVNIRPWMVNPNLADLQRTRESISRPYKAIMADGQGILQAEGERARLNGHDATTEELIELLTGKSGETKGRRDQKAQRFIDVRDLMALEMELSHFDPLDSLRSLSCENGKARLEGTLRLFITVMWFTGMRPAEVWTSALMVPRMDLTFTPDMVRQVMTNPAKAIHSELMVTVEDLRADTGGTLGTAARNAMLKSGAPCVLVIKSAKTSNQNPELRTAMRLQILSKIPERQLNLISLATQSRHLQLEAGRKDNIRASMTRILKTISKDEPRFQDMTLNLYAFRHSFATRAKLVYAPHEAAALTGHTSKNTLHGYGERNLRKGGAGGKGRFNKEWIPSPDPVQAEMIRRGWAGELLATNAPQLG